MRIRHALSNTRIIGVVMAQQFGFGSPRGASAIRWMAVGLLLCTAGPCNGQDAPYLAQSSNRVDARTLAGWRAVRQFDCARCHGARYQGSIGPSLVEAARVNDRTAFVRLVLEGNPPRGMPPYRDVRGVADNVDGIYGYFRGRADGNIGEGALDLLQ